ncbi:hypothetical protein AAVH_27485, partial [Aphelenchoides avenae]
MACLTLKLKAAVEYPRQKDTCADLCIIDEAGNECTFSNTSAQINVGLQAYCVKG